MTKIGFWLLLGALVLRAGVVSPALLGRRPELSVRLAAAGVLLALYVANTVLTARRVVAADNGSTADRVWVLGAIGLALAGAIASLI